MNGRISQIVFKVVSETLVEGSERLWVDSGIRHSVIHDEYCCPCLS